MEKLNKTVELCSQQLMRMGIPEDIALMIAFENCGFNEEALQLAETKRAEQQSLINETYYMEKMCDNSIDVRNTENDKTEQGN